MRLGFRCPNYVSVLKMKRRKWNGFLVLSGYWGTPLNENCFVELERISTTAEIFNANRMFVPQQQERVKQIVWICIFDSIPTYTFKDGVFDIKIGNMKAKVIEMFFRKKVV